jgi:tetratricopeptide (TPR) repeat protein
MISLRAYNKEIENLIEHGQYDEAVSHCKLILSSYPKCIDTYRILGQTLLENKKYKDALDIFMRVLSVFPDDFISHVGLSIIYEDERNLDLSISHMERSFDVQPSNLAIQEELKRLFGRRDGVQPQKIRLSKGALIRMYAKGELYQQAIAEIKSTITEDPKRTDLEVILARMYFLSGSIVESAEVCNQIIEKFPYCFETNKILFDIFTKNGNFDNAQIFHQRLETLDPYYKFTDTSSSISVPDDKILLEKLSGTPAFLPDSEFPDWKKSISDNWDLEKDLKNSDSTSGLTNEVISQIESSDIPELLSTDAQSEIGNGSNDSDRFPESTQNEDIPGWMKNAGWVSSNGSNEAENPSFEWDNSSTRSEPAQNAQIPDWLKEIAPENTFTNPDQSESVSPQTGNGSDLEHIEDHTENSDKPPEMDSFRQSISGWEREDKMENDNSKNKDEGEQINSNADPFASLRNDSDDDIKTPIENQDLPDWLKNFEQDKTATENETIDIPDWMRTLKSEVSNNSSIDNQQTDQQTPIVDADNQEMIPPIFENDIPDVLSRIIGQDQSDSQTSPDQFRENDGSINLEVESMIPSPEVPLINPSIPEVGDWHTENINPDPTGEHLSSSDSLEQNDQEIPLWVKSVIGNNDINPEPIETQEKITTEISNNPFTEDTNGKPSIDQISLPEIENSNSGAISDQTNEELLDWLRGLKPDDDLLESEFSTTDSILQETTEIGTSPLDAALDRLGQVSDNPDDSQRIDQESKETIPPHLETIENHIPDVALPAVETLNVENPNESSIGNDSTMSTIPTPIEQNIDVSTDESISEKVILSTENFEADSSDQPSDIDQFNDLIEKKMFDSIPEVFSKLLVSGKDCDSLIESFVSLSGNSELNLSYWQCLGDLKSRCNHLEEALDAYKKAENMLLESIRRG